ncbi:MAG: GlpG protein [Saprospiraceae bacterium]|jgi:GlpG protein
MLSLSLLKRCKVTTALLVCSVIVALISGIGSRFDAVLPFLISAYLSPVLPEVLSGEAWRLITPIFVHFGVMHLLFNSMMTFQLGSLLEPQMGILRFSFLILILAISSNLAQYFATGPSFGGLSGVLYGLFGYFWMASRFNPTFDMRINPSAVKMLMGWFVLCWFNFFGLLGNIAIANIAHTMGLAMGMISAIFVAKVLITR